ncbi:helix-turn-helix transcriptional regulator [Enterococcus thailandicus]|uniref:helix-turn-helix transcriptional regulator n=1 Tax=Enterococcus thailandicus TaxID=417368 RepID=UPI002890708A|nr:helix-turn-helix transcriptional regulator [Enterococcus thailandicus]MDT2752309.1 helix-turn-helix transcriptional regulator [Enterococcus thailandicus]MDT2776802.1 helix-turn-helix transcriptional regulator [Enterococcus thailandicus]
MSQDFILKVKVELARHDKSQAWLAQQIGISTAYMSDILKGKRKPDKQVKPIEAVLSTLQEGK